MTVLDSRIQPEAAPRPAATPGQPTMSRNPEDRLAAIEERADDLVSEFETLAREWQETGERELLGAVYAKTRSAIARLGPELGV